MTATTSLDPALTQLLTGSLRETFATTHGPDEISDALDELGWSDVAAESPAAATTLLFVEHGRALASSRLLDEVLLDELTEHLPSSGVARALAYHVEGVSGAILLAHLDGVDEVVVPTAEGYRVLAADSLGRRPVTGFDATATWQAIADNATAGAPGWDLAVAAGRRAVCAEIIGVMEVALEMSVTHTGSRIQYGRPIGSFQAVRHRLAESHAEVVAARRMLITAWANAADPVLGPWTATQAKIRAGLAQKAVCANAIQVHGGMGVSQESDVHRYVSRAAMLDLLLGSASALLWQTGESLLNGAPAYPLVDI